jgi:hypothetical protein
MPWKRASEGLRRPGSTPAGRLEGPSRGDEGEFLGFQRPIWKAVRPQTALSKGLFPVSYPVAGADEPVSIDQLSGLAWWGPDSMTPDGLPLESLDRLGLVMTSSAATGRLLRCPADPSDWR